MRLEFECPFELKAASTHCDSTKEVLESTLTVILIVRCFFGELLRVDGKQRSDDE